VLAFSNSATITGSWDAVTGTLTLIGSDTVANFQAALRSVTYQNTSENPSPATRTIGITVHDTTADSNTSSRNVAVERVNDAPLGVSDSYAVGNNSVLNVLGNGVLSNDADLEADALGVVLVTAPQHGTLILHDNGEFLYLPQINFSGADSFVYQAWDGAAVSTPVTVTILVTLEAGPTDGGGLPPGPRDGGQPAPPPPPPRDDDREHTRPPAVADESLPDRTRRHLSESHRFAQVAWGGGGLNLSSGNPAEAQLQRRAERASAAVKARLSARPLGWGAAVDWRSGEEFVGQLGNELAKQLSSGTVVIGAATMVTVTAGYVFWALRGGFLVATVLSSLPAWASFDLLPIFDARDRRRRPEGGDDDSLESLIRARKEAT
jgi:hypothetical protein